MWFIVYPKELDTNLLKVFSNYFKAWAKSFDYQSKSLRNEFWGFYIINMILMIIFFISYGTNETLFNLYFTASFLPSIPLHIRRLRDINKSWFWVIPMHLFLIGNLLSLILLTKPSKETNKETILGDLGELKKAFEDGLISEDEYEKLRKEKLGL